MFSSEYFLLIILPALTEIDQLQLGAEFVARIAELTSVHVLWGKYCVVFHCQNSGDVLSGMAGHGVLIWGGQLSKNLRAFKILLQRLWCSFKNPSYWIYLSICFYHNFFFFFVLFLNTTAQFLRILGNQGSCARPRGWGKLQGRGDALREKAELARWCTKGTSLSSREDWVLTGLPNSEETSCPPAASFPYLSKMTLFCSEFYCYLICV